MMRVALAAALGVMVVAGGACARRTVPRPTQSDATRGQVELAALREGRTLYLSACAGCHQPILPSAHTPVEWPAHVEEMRERAHLDPRESRLVITYLRVMSTPRP